MSRPSFNILESYTGTGLLDEYSFEFKIFEENQILLRTSQGNETRTERRCIEPSMARQTDTFAAYPDDLPKTCKPETGKPTRLLHPV